MSVQVSDTLTLGALSAPKSTQLPTDSVRSSVNSIETSATVSSRPVVPSPSRNCGSVTETQSSTRGVSKISSISSKISATSETLQSPLVASSCTPLNGSSTNVTFAGDDRPVNSNILFNSLQPVSTLGEIETGINVTSNGICKGTAGGGGSSVPENSVCSSSPQSTVNSVILPALIEAPGATPTQLLIPVPDTRPGTDQQPLSQQLSFPNLSAPGQSAVPVSSSSNDDPLRTPPRPFIEDHTSKTDSNIGPAAPSTVPPPVEVVQPIKTPSTCINSSTSTSSSPTSSLSDVNHHQQHTQQHQLQQQSKRPTAIRKSTVSTPYTPTSIPVSVVTSVRSNGLTSGLGGDATTSATSAPIHHTLSPNAVNLNVNGSTHTPVSNGHLNSNHRTLIHRSLNQHSHHPTSSNSTNTNSSSNSAVNNGPVSGTINSGRASTIVSLPVNPLSVNGHTPGNIGGLAPLLPPINNSVVPHEHSHIVVSRSANIVSGNRLNATSNERITLSSNSLTNMVSPVMASNDHSGISVTNNTASILTPSVSNDQSIIPSSQGQATQSSLKPPPLSSGNPTKPFKCPLCEKDLASKNVYQLHLRSHSGEKPFVCNICRNAFSQKTSLTRHMRSHTGERPYPCEICAKRFADKERIKIHLRTHTGEKPFACSICHKTFSQKSTVKRHMSVHTGEKPFQCSHCGKGFANRGNLTAHEKTHTHKSDKIFY